MIGAFHQPQAVIADTSTLNTLPDNELSAGLAEVIKYGLIGDAGLRLAKEQYQQVARARPASQPLPSNAPAKIKPLLSRKTKTKRHTRHAQFRAYLRSCHRGHQGYGQWLHGEAVGTGMLQTDRPKRALGQNHLGASARAKTAVAASQFARARP